MKEPGYLRGREKGRRDRAFVVIEGKRIYLGEHGSAESRANYHRVLLEWRSGGGHLPVDPGDITLVEVLSSRPMGEFSRSPRHVTISPSPD